MPVCIHIDIYSLCNVKTCHIIKYFKQQIGKSTRECYSGKLLSVLSLFSAEVMVGTIKYFPAILPFEIKLELQVLGCFKRYLGDSSKLSDSLLSLSGPLIFSYAQDISE